MRRPEFIAKHGGMPHGWLGQLVASIMERETTAINQDAIALLDPKVREAVLDVGTGNGLSLRHLASRVVQLVAEPEVRALVVLVVNGVLRV